MRLAAVLLKVGLMGSEEIEMLSTYLREDTRPVRRGLFLHGDGIVWQILMKEVVLLSISGNNKQLVN
jgi:hypothetical protein